MVVVLKTVVDAQSLRLVLLQNCSLLESQLLVVVSLLRTLLRVFCSVKTSILVSVEGLLESVFYWGLLKDILRSLLDQKLLNCWILL
jgi:hypothetical protein